MAYIQEKDIKSLYTTSKSEARIWREDFPAYERLADNGLMEGLDPNLPEVNDGSLAAALFKLPKRIVSSKLTGVAKALDRDEAWVGELANIVWQKEIVPYANTQAPFHRKWKDAVRKAGIYGSVPLITIFVDKDGRRHSDFIVGQPQDVTLEPGKISDYDSDIQFWDIYYSKLQLENFIEEAKKEQETAKKDTDTKSTNKYDIPALEAILAAGLEEERSSEDTPSQQNTKNVRPVGFKFCIAVQRGVNAPFYMYYSSTNKVVKSWANPDPTGDSMIHFLYCYQDFINPYGIGIVKLAGGTQNVLDYMRQADVLATQLGLQPPLDINGDSDSVDLESLVYANRALWFTGNAKVTPVNISNATYQGLPERMAMYKTSLNQLIPTGDTSISAGAGDPNYSKTPAGVKFQAASLSIDDEDFKDNLYITYEAVAKSMINTHFANMEGKDLIKISEDEKERLVKAGMEFPLSPNGKTSNELEIVWDTVRAKFEFEIDPEKDKNKDDAERLDGLKSIAELIATDPMIEQDLAMANKKLNKGELYAEMIALTTDNDKIITDVSTQDQESQLDPITGQLIPSQSIGQPSAQNPMQPMSPQDGQSQIDPLTEQKMRQSDEKHQMDMQLKAQKLQQQPQQQSTPQPSEQEIQANVEGVMAQYGVDENTALAALAAENQGYPMEDIIKELQKRSMAGVR